MVLLDQETPAPSPAPAPDAAPPPELPEGLPEGVMDWTLTQWDLVSFPGLVLAVVTAVGFLKFLFPNLVEGKEPYIGLALSYILGVGSKLTIPYAFKGVHWIVFLVSLLGVAAAAKLAHDYWANEILKKPFRKKKKE